MRKSMRRYFLPFTLLLAALLAIPQQTSARNPRGSARPVVASLSIGASAAAASSFTEGLSTSSITTQATGSTFVVFEATGGGLLAPTDNKGNTYHATPDFSFLFNASNSAGSIWICQNCAGGAGHVFTANLSTFSSVVLIVVEVASTGGLFPILDQSAFTSNIANATTGNSPSVTPTVNGEVILSFMGGAAGNITINDSTGYNNILQSNGNGGSNGNLVAAIGGFKQSTAAATHDVFTMSGTTNLGTATMAFKPN
jgi:hypothetical protein